jgi:hypothetical protein
MPNLAFNVVLPFVFVTLDILTPPVDAVVIRHDRDEAAAQKLATEYDQVGRILPNGCCTLVAPTWAITAAHVAASVKPNDSIEFNGKKYTVKQTVLHPEGKGPANTPPEVDLALIELTDSVLNVTPAKLYADDDELNQVVVIVGYGDFGTPSQKLKRTDGKRRAVTNKIDDAGPRRIFMKFDQPPAATEHEGVGGPGDSGGPALIRLHDDVYIVGVSSASMNGRPGTYNVTDVYVRISSYRKWIEQKIGKK